LKDRDLVGYDHPMAELSKEVVIRRTERLVAYAQERLREAKDSKDTKRQAKAVAYLRVLLEAAPKNSYPIFW